MNFRLPQNYAVFTNKMSDLHLNGDPSSVNFNNKNITELQSLTTLESLNDDCLAQICQYLSLFGVAKLASTCTRLHEFANTFVFPKAVKKVEIKFTYETDSSDDSFSIFTTEMDYLVKPFEGFGYSIEQLTFNGSMEDCDDFLQPIETDNLSSIAKLLDLCPNLHSLCFQQVRFTSDNIYLLSHVTPDLKELKFVRCASTTDDWSKALKRFPTLEHITLTGSEDNETTAVFFENTRNLSSLAISYDNLKDAQDLETLFYQNRSSLQKLEITNYYQTTQYQSIRTLIVELPKLEYLSIDDRLSQELIDSLDDLPQLKSLKIWCGGMSVNSLLRKLSDLGTIEDLDIKDVVYDMEIDVRPLIFNQLKSIRLTGANFSVNDNEVTDLVGIFKSLIISEMPVITCFDFELKDDEQGRYLLELFKSKPTVKTMFIAFASMKIKMQNRCALVIRIIDILKMNEKRRPLNLKVSPLRFDDVQVS